MPPNDEHPDWGIGKVREYRWLRHGTPLPEDHETADDGAVVTHHKRYARLVRRTL